MKYRRRIYYSATCGLGIGMDTDAAIGRVFDRHDHPGLFRSGMAASATIDVAKRRSLPPSGMPDSRWGFPSGPISDSMW